MQTLSIIIPVYNEARTIGLALEKVRSVDIGQWAKEIIVVDDCSTDATEQRLLPYREQITLLQHTKNCGKGAAVRTGLVRAGGDAIIIHDADLEYDPADWTSMLAQLDKPDIVAVFGSRNIHSKRQGYRLYVWGVNALTACVNFLYGSHLTDIYTGAKLVRTDILRSLALTANGFNLEAEITCKLLKRGLQIIEVPVTYIPRTFSEGKKIRGWRDGWIGLGTIGRLKITREGDTPIL